MPAWAHPPGPVLVVGGAGTGKTELLARRVAHLVAGGVAPGRVLALAPAQAGADRLRALVPDAEVEVATPQALATRLLSEGPEPFLAPATAADRLAMLLDRVDELTLREHDFRGRPAALLGGFVERVDRLKALGIACERYAEWARGRGGRDEEFAAIFAAHDRMLAGRGSIDLGEVVLRALRLDDLGARCDALLVDDLPELSQAEATLVRALEPAADANVTVTGDDDQSASATPTGHLRAFADAHPDGMLERLEVSHRCPPRILTAARAVVVPEADRIGKALEGRPEDPDAPTPARFWRCANERAQAQGVAADVERLVARGGVAPERIAVLVRSTAKEGQAVAVALEERAVPYRVVGAAAFFERAEVRDVLAWLRLLADPGDSGAVVRALSRPPVDLRSVDLARCIQIARRRKLDMVSGLVAATESPQITPEARDRILAFLKLHRAAAGALDTTRPDLFVHRLIERLGLRRQQLFAAQTDVVERLVNLARFGELAAGYTRRSPQATPREFARYIAAVAEAGMGEEEAVAETHPRAVQVLELAQARGAEFDHVYVLGLHAARIPGARTRAVQPVPAELGGVDDAREAHVAQMRRLTHLAMTRARVGLVLAYPATGDRGATQPPSPFFDEARAALEAPVVDVAEELFGPAETLHSTFRMMRDELLDSVQRTGGRLGELRFDTDLDVSHSVVRLLEVLKMSALLARPSGQAVADALPDINQRLLGAVTREQRDIFETSALDDLLLDAERDDRQRAASVARRSEPSLEAFLPRRGDGLVLSASDIDTYRTCPLKYKFARVFRIPAEPTLNQRFGILVHQVLERWHAGSAQTPDEMQRLLEIGWRRGGFGDSEEERQLRAKASSSLARVWERSLSEPGEPAWLERSFSFRLGAHTLRGRVDRVDRLPEGGFELIDYKTGRPRSAAALREDVQLSLYAVGAREAWSLDAADQAYLYVLDDQKVRVPSEDIDPSWIEETVHEVADGILAQGFEPTPSYSACAMCDFRIACPAAEK